MVATSPLRSGQVSRRIAVFFMAYLFRITRMVIPSTGLSCEESGLSCPGEQIFPLRYAHRRNDNLLGDLNHDLRSSFKISRAALAPEPPVSPTPGCVPEPQRYKFWIGVR